MKQPQFLFFLCMLFAISSAEAQVGIGIISPDPSAQLDVTSTNKGLLVPRLTFAQQNAITLPASGLIVFNTTSNRLTYNIGTTSTPIWESVLGTTSGWSTTGNNNIIDGTNFLGTTSNVPLNFHVNSQKAGRIDNTNGITGFGYQSLNNNSGTYNTAIGQASLFTNTSGTGITALGYQSGYLNSTGNNITAIGYQAGYNNTTNNNSFFGYQAGYSNTSGGSITAAGYKALFANSTGTSNSAFGTSALTANTTGGFNTAVGANALQANTTGQTNTAVGQFTLGSNTTGGGNTGIGQSTLSSNTTGSSNSAVGGSSMSANTTGTANVAVGQSAMIKNSTGNYNTVVGQSALNSSIIGSNKTAIGYQAGATDSLGGNNTYLGYQADQGVISATSLINATAIGYQAKVNASNSLILGGTASNAVNVGIGTAAPSATLEVIGKTKTATFQMTTSGTNGYVLTSDASGNGTWQASSGGGWGLLGNSGTTSSSNFIGTTDSVSLRFRTNNLSRVIIDSLGHVGVGTLTPTQKFHVVGTDTATSVIAASTTVLGQYENTNTGSTCIDLKTTNTSGHTLSTRIGINPTYTSTGGTGVMAWYANYDGNYRILHCYDFVNNNYLIAPSIAGYTVNNVGVGTTAPASSFDINGSFAAAIATVTTNTILDGTYYTVIITGGSPTITFPAAGTCARRIYVIVNQSGSTRTVSSYKNLSGTNTTTVTNGSSIMIQSNGTNWYQIK